MRTTVKYLLFIAAIVDTMIVWVGVPIVALDLVSKSIHLKENTIILAVFILGLAIWLSGWDIGGCRR